MTGGVLYNPAAEQTTFVSCFGRDAEDLKRRNDLLGQGWQVVPVTSEQRDEGRSDRCYSPPTVLFFVVLERRKPGP